MIKKFKLTFLFLILLLPLFALGQGIIPCTDDCNYNDFITLIYNIITFLLKFVAVPVATGSIFYAGILYATSSTNPSNRGKAYGIIKTALLGLLLALAAQLIVTSVLNFLTEEKVDIPVPQTRSFLVERAHADQDIVPGPSGNNSSEHAFQILKWDSIPEFINGLLELVVQLGWPLLVLAIIYVGFLFVEARGNESKLQAAKQAAWYTLIGAAIIIGSFAISEAIKATIDSITNSL